MEKIRASKLVEALERATLMAKQLPTADPSLTVQIYSTLHATHFHLSSFICHSAIGTTPPQPSLQLPDTTTSPMLIGDDDVDPQLEEAAASKAVLDDGVEEELGTGDSFMIRNKRVQKKEKKKTRSSSPGVVTRGMRRRKLDDQVA